MSWTVTIRDATNTTAVATVEDGLVSGEVVLRGFDAPIVTPPGSGRVLNLYARQASLGVPPRSIVQFAIDATPVFWGPAVVVPALDSPGAGPFDTDRDALERITVVGGEQLLKDSIVGPRLITGIPDDEPLGELVEILPADVSEVAFIITSLYAHPALVVEEGNFPLTGAVLSVFYAPERALFDALTDLAGTVPGGAQFWVDATGAVHFEALEAGS